MIGIIQDETRIRGRNEGASPQAILNFSGRLKKLGFKKCYLEELSVNRDTLQDELTIAFSPSLYGVERTEHNARRDSFVQLRDYLMSLSGSPGNFSYYYALKRYETSDQVELKVRYDNKLYIIGHYVKSMNLALIYFPLDGVNWALGKDNEYINFILSQLEELAKNIKFEEVDVTEIKKQRMISRYTQVIEKKLDRCKDELRNSESKIEEFKRGLVEATNSVSLNKFAVIGLEKMLKDVNKSLLDQIEDIRKLKFVKNVELTTEGIKIWFEKISIKVKEKDIEMGDYEIILFQDKIRITNAQPVRYQHTTYHSCHISGDNICFGSQNSMAYDLLGKLELKKLVHFLYLYLKSYNPEDTYLSMNYWIAGKKNGGEVPDDYDEDEEEHEGQTYCNECDEWVDDDNFNHTEDMCDDCWENNSVYCNECGDRVPTEEYNSNEDMCDSCWERVGRRCSECGSEVHEDDFDSELDMCSDCATNHGEEEEEENEEGEQN